MTLIRPLLLLGICLVLTTAAQAAERTKARLILSAEAAAPASKLTAAVELKMPPGWHTYWKNAGDSGLGTTIDWRLPEGVTAGEIQWPVPEKYTALDLTTYVYHDTVLLLVPLEIAAGVAPGSLDLRARVAWLECEEICLPGKADVQARLVIGPETVSSKEAPLIDSWKKRLPVNGASLAVEAVWDQPPGEDLRHFVMKWNSREVFAEVDFFPYGYEGFEVTGKTDRLKGEGNQVLLRKAVRKFGDAWPQEVSGLLWAKASSDSQPAGYEVKFALAELSESEGARSPEAGGSASSSEPTAVRSAAPQSLWVMLGLAFLGGLILNIMPCVLPVIALKILGFVNQSKEEPARVRQLGMVYALGVLASFLVLAGIIIGIQQAGRAASWGMQFQNPQFLVGMTVLVTLVALNLFGLFEITLSGGAMQSANLLASKEGNAGAFFHGVLATALATPCTAPFLGVALGFAFAQSPMIIVVMFMAVAMGLASPYVVLSWKPGWLKFLPKPGVWMQKFKVAMGFPMLATAVWLLWLCSSHFGRGGVLWLGLFLVGLAMAAWVWGEFVQHGARRRGLAMAISVLMALGSYWFVLENQLQWRAPRAASAGPDAIRAKPGGIPWRAWSLAAVEEARAAGHPVLVDFTADWCVTCQVNKKTSLEIPSVKEKLKEIKAVAFLGDYTNEDPAITAELQKHQRAGVPLVLVYPADRKAGPYVLPEVLTPDLVLEHLQKAASSTLVSRVDS